MTHADVPALDASACRALLRRPDLEVMDLAGYFADVERRSGEPLPHVRAQVDRLLFFVRGERHRALRAHAQAFFRPGLVAQWRPAVAACAEAVVGRLGETADLVEAFAGPVSSEAICRILGLPVEQRARFDEWVEEIRWLTEPMLPLRRLRVIERRLGEFAEAVRAAGRTAPAGPPTFLHAPLAGLDDDDRVWLAVVLYGAGQSTLHTLANILDRLLDAPEERAALLDETERMAAVDRLIAIGGSIQYVSRLAPAGFEACGVRRPEGGRIDLPLAAANRAQVEQARLAAAAPHLAFGAGLHRCVGALLARTIVAEALAALLRRYPNVSRLRPSRGMQSSAVIVSPLDLPCRLK